jgi:hypothetical protein
MAGQYGEEAQALDDLAGQLDRWTAEPVDLNGPESAELLAWQLLTPALHQALVDHVARHGPLLSVLELQAIPGFTPDLIRLLQPLVAAGPPDALATALPLFRRFVRGEDELYLRGGRTLQHAAGFTGEAPAYAGSPDRLYLRYRHRHGTTLSYGFTMEKDAGEPLISPGALPLPDYWSYHLFIKPGKPWCQMLLLGDFTVRMGQGLVMHNGFGGGKGATATSVKRSGQTLRPYSSVDENTFMRGIGMTVRPRNGIEITVFASRQRQDGNGIPDTSAVPGGTELRGITSLQSSGLHRTAAELADQDVVRATHLGCRIGHAGKRSGFGLNALHTRFGHALMPREELYNQFDFRGNALSQFSIDYGFFLGGIHFFGESAISGNGGQAHLHGLLASPHRRINLALVVRHYARDYHALSSNAFGENTLPRNERGLYAGLQVIPAPRWRIDLYQDLWRHPWLRFNVDAPTEGHETFLRASYAIRRRMELFGQCRYRQTSVNDRLAVEPNARVIPQSSAQFRLQLNQQLGRGVQFRTRVAWTTYHRPGFSSSGLLIAQDILVDPIGSPWSGTARLALFDTEDYDSRIYAYENDLIYYYAIPAYSDKGTRYYVTLRYKGIRHLTIECKIAETLYRNLTEIGSGQDRIAGNRRTEIRMQVIYRR